MTGPTGTGGLLTRGLPQSVRSRSIAGIPPLCVYHVVSSLMFGGGQRVALNLVEQLHCEHDLDVRLVVLGSHLAPGFQPSAARQIHLRAYDGRYNRPASLIRAALSVRRLLRARPADIVHTHGWDCDVIAGLARIGLPVQQVVHQHVLAEWTSSSKFVHHVRRRLTRTALHNRRTSWVTVSHAVKESLEPLDWLPSSHVRVVWNGVDLARFHPPVAPAGNSVPVIGVAARLTPVKGLEYLIQAVAHLRRRGLDCEVRIAGEGPLHHSLLTLAASLNISDRVSLLGQREEMGSFYNSIDVMALPSVSEGLPLSILEAMASGVPVVSTRVSGIPEIVIDGVTGRLVPARDPHALANALEPLLRSRNLREQMGQAGRAHVEAGFSIRRMCLEVAALYSDMVRSTRPDQAVN